MRGLLSGPLSSHPRPTTKLLPLGMMPWQVTVLSSTCSVVPGSRVRYLRSHDLREERLAARLQR